MNTSFIMEIHRKTYLARLKASSIKPARLLTERSYEANQKSKNTKVESFRIRMADVHMSKQIFDE